MPRALEHAGDQERLFDFCLWEYPPHAPCEGKLRSINLLARSFDAEGLPERAHEVVHAIRRELGDSRSVWGVKQDASGISWEFYFYDYGRLERERSIPRLLGAVKPWIPCEVATSERHPYFMFSIDFGREQLAEGRPIEEVQMYIGNIGSYVSSGVCYGVTRSRTTLKNFYFFFDAKRDMQEVIGKLTSSAYLDLPGLDLDAILLPELVDCQTIVVSNKRDRDGVYFCRIDVRQLLFFLKRMRFPRAQVDFVEQNADRLDHMLYDVGFDFRVENGELRVVKSAYYGTF
jgi:hypothetical protein